MGFGHRIGIAVLSFASVATLAAVHAQGAQQARPPQTHAISVEIICRADGGATTTITPWQLRVRQNDSVEWVLTDSSNVTEIEVKKKQFGWLFDDGPPYRARPGAAARATRMKNNQAGKRYSYSVHSTCPNPDGTTAAVVIDPDIIVD